jgi:hypothetical protein
MKPWEDREQLLEFCTIFAKALKDSGKDFEKAQDWCYYWVVNTLIPLMRVKIEEVYEYYPIYKLVEEENGAGGKSGLNLSADRQVRRNAD